MIRFAQIMILFGIISIFSLLFGFTHGVAAPPAQEATPIPNLSISDEYCLSCHGQPGQTYPLDDGTTLDLFVDPVEHANSIHGSQ